MAEEKTYTQDDMDTEVAGLKLKNEELIRKNKNIDKSLTEFKEKFDGIDLELLQAQSQELAKFKQDAMSDDEKRAERRENRKKEALAKDQALLDANAKVEHLTFSNAISSAIRDTGAVVEGLGSALSRELRAMATLAEDGSVKVGDVLMSDFVPEFAKNGGKNFFVPKNAGGGAVGGGGSATPDGIKNADGTINYSKVAQVRKTGTPDQVQQVEQAITQANKSKT